MHFEKNKIMKVVARNRKAKYKYFIEDLYEVGLVLFGTEVKSLRMGLGNLTDSYARIKNGEIFVYQVYIGKYPYANRDNHDPIRSRKLLLHRYQINKIYDKINSKGCTLVPIKIYFKNNKIKMSLGLVKGKKQYDKRRIIAQRDQKRDIKREYKNYNFNK